jgi:hypothetical protein
MFSTIATTAAVIALVILPAGPGTPVHTESSFDRIIAKADVTWDQCVAGGGHLIRSSTESWCAGGAYGGNQISKSG